jgi:glycerophosphoryl diester phosphodiesterase
MLTCPVNTNPAAQRMVNGSLIGGGFDNGHPHDLVRGWLCAGGCDCEELNMAATFSGTRKERDAKRAAWNQAIREGRMVNFGEDMGHLVRPYNSPEAAQLAVDAAQEAGVDAFIVPAHLAEE